MFNAINDLFHVFMQFFSSRALLILVLIGIMLFAFSPGNWTPAWVVNHDKFSHLMAFLLLAFLLNNSLPRIKISILVVLLVSFAIGIELFQWTFVNRGFSTVDILYDLFGIGLFLIWVHVFEVVGLKKSLKMYMNTRLKDKAIK
jgi:hypothetical protein